MVVFIVSDETTIARLDEVREQHARRVDPRGRPQAEDAKLLERAPAVAWMAYGIHGDELSSVDAAAAVAYWLVAGEDDLARKMRRELVVLIDPCENPDGRERFLAQTQSFAHAIRNPDTEDLSHTTVWPWGRGNHYLFDLNRDWFSMVQPESRRSTVIASWNPQLMVDSHEMGAHDTYLFSPPRHPFNPHIPEYEWRWSDRFAADQARALDRRGYAYYTREWNEEFFPGYGSSWASYHGAIGILYEMSGTEGTLVHQRRGTRRTYPQAVEHQVASSVANLTTLADNRVELLTDFVNGRREVIERGRRGPVGAWILPHGRHPERTDALVQLLRDGGIEVLRASSSPPRVAGLRDMRTGESVAASDLPDATWMVPLDQPAGSMVRVLLDPHVPMDAKFFREEREYLERDKGSRLYEVTSWSLPLAYGIEAHWTSQRPTSGWSDDPVAEREGTLESSATDEPFGYLMSGDSDQSVLALSDLLAQGLALFVAGKPFSVEGQAFDRGAILIPREGNAEDLKSRLEAVVRDRAVRVVEVPTAKASTGPDLGGKHFHKLVAPRVGIWTGSPVSASAYGALWHLFDERLRMRFSGLDLMRFERTDLSRYNVLIFPPGSTYRELLGPDGFARLVAWIKAGGTAIGIGGGAEFLADEKSELTKTKLRRQALERYPPAVMGPTARLVASGGNFRAVGLRAETAKDRKEDADRKPASVQPQRDSLYDVAPLLGPGAAPFAEGFEQGTPAGVPVALTDWLKPFLPPGKEKPEKQDLERADERLRRFAPRGTFLRVELDHEVWLSWGIGDELPVLVRARDTLVAEPPVQVAARFADLDRLHLGGLLWPEAAGRLAHTAYVTREGVGRGQVILFLSEPEFRGWTLGTRRLLLNAILYGPGLGTRWATPW